MSALRRLPAITSILAVGFSLATFAASPSMRGQLSKSFGLNAPGGTWRFLAILLALLNFKNLPLVWHYRVFRAMIYQIYVQPKNLPKEALFLPMITSSHTPLLETDYNFHKSNSTYYTDLDVARVHLMTAIMRKGIRGMGKDPENNNARWTFANTTRAAGSPRARKDGGGGAESAKESNGSLPNSRGSLPSLQISPLGTSAVESGLNTPARMPTPDPTRLDPTPNPSTAISAPSTTNLNPSTPPTLGGLSEEQWWHEAAKPGNVLIALGGNSCHFHREIPPYTRFEIWTRLLSWDRKWFYVVSHFVEAGAFTPRRYILQPRRRGPGLVVGNNKTEATGWAEMTDDERAKARRKIYATSVSKYVIKKGRLTIPPELALYRSEMMPPRPPGAPGIFSSGPPSDSPSPAGAGSGQGSRASPEPSSEKTLGVLEQSLFAGDGADDDGDGARKEEWTWERVEAERQRGLRLCQMFDELDGLRESFDLGANGVLGRFADLVAGI